MLEATQAAQCLIGVRALQGLGMALVDERGVRVWVLDQAAVQQMTPGPIGALRARPCLAVRQDQRDPLELGPLDRLTSDTQRPIELMAIHRRPQAAVARARPQREALRLGIDPGRIMTPEIEPGFGH